MNLALLRHSTRGGPEDVIAVLNPDLCFLPGSLGTMILDYVRREPRSVAPSIRGLDHRSPWACLNLPRNILADARRSVPDARDGWLT